MAQRPLNPTGGEATIVAVRLPARDLDRLARVARKRGVSRSDVVRDALRRAFDEGEAVPA